MKEYNFKLFRPVTGISVQQYSVMAENEDDAIEKFQKAFESGEENLLRDGEEHFEPSTYAERAIASIEETGTEIEIEF